MQDFGDSMWWIVGVSPLEQWPQFFCSLVQSAVQMQGSPKDDMFGDFSRRAQTRYEPSLQLFFGKRRDCALEGVLIVLPTFEGTRFRYCCSCHYSLYF